MAGFAWLVLQLVAWCCAGLVVVLWWLWTTRPRTNAPGPPPLPIIGNILDLWQLPLTIRKIRDFHQQYGDLLRFYLGPMLMVMVAHPDDVQQVLVTAKLTQRDAFTTRSMRPFVGDSLLAINGTKWKTHRKLINPTFHSELLEGFLDAFHEGGQLLCERLGQKQGAPCDLYPLVFLEGLRTVCHTVIGIDPDLLVPDAVAEAEITDGMTGFMDTIQKMVLRPWLQQEFLLQLTSSGRGLLKYRQLMRGKAMQCIAIRSAATEEGPAKLRLRLLEALVKPGGETALPLDEVRDELITLAFSGTETTSMTISNALTLLALHPTWQDAVHRELKDVFGEGDDSMRAASLADLGRLRILESVIKETLRLYPAIPVLPREVQEDLWLGGGRVLVPKGSLVAVTPFLTHRLPEFFPEPQRFDPGRFLDGGAGRKDHPCCYVPFGLGARNCVGGQYARLQLKVLLASVLRRFRVLPHSRREDLEDNTISIVAHPMKPLRVFCVPLDLPPRASA